MRERGNQIKPSAVLVGMLLVLAAVVSYFFVASDKNEVSGMDDSRGEQVYASSPSYYGKSDPSVNAIGPQRSPQKEARNRRLNSQMIQFLELQHVE